jgi:hypothetical protein
MNYTLHGKESMFDDTTTTVCDLNLNQELTYSTCLKAGGSRTRTWCIKRKAFGTKNNNARFYFYLHVRKQDTEEILHFTGYFTLL